MADDGRHSNHPSTPSTRRGSVDSAQNPPAGQQQQQQQQQYATQSQSSSVHFGSASQMSETTRKRPPASQTRTEGYGRILYHVHLFPVLTLHRLHKRRSPLPDCLRTRPYKTTQEAYLGSPSNFYTRPSQRPGVLRR